MGVVAPAILSEFSCIHFYLRAAQKAKKSMSQLQQVRCTKKLFGTPFTPATVA
jgi:hypothetical protein